MPKEQRRRHSDQMLSPKKPSTSKWRCAVLRFVPCQHIRAITRPNSFETRLEPPLIGPNTCVTALPCQYKDKTTHATTQKRCFWRVHSVLYPFNFTLKRWEAFAAAFAFVEKCCCPSLGCTPRGSCKNTLLRRVLRRFSNSKCFLEGFLEGACMGFQ